MNNNYKTLNVWGKSMSLVKEIYTITSDFPKEELYGIVSQIRRSAISIPSNIAEGSGRNGNGEFKQFLFIAKGSCYELETQIILSLDLGFIKQKDFDKLNQDLQEIIKMIQGLINSFKLNT